MVMESSGRATVLNEPGPRFTVADALLRAVAAHAGGVPLVVTSGSLPPGLPPDTDARVCRTARNRGAAMIVDSARVALAGVLGAEPDLVSPHLAEAGGLVTGFVVESEPTASRVEIRERAHLAARSLPAAGARRAVVTAGRHGAACIDDRGDLWWRTAVRHGVLVASASVEHPRAGRVDPGRVAQLAAMTARNADGGDQVA